MEESFYHKQADTELTKLLEYLEELEETTDLEVELESGVLTVTMPNKRQYVINKHTPSRQIWVSSPYTGAGYYELSDAGDWQPKRVNAGANLNLFDFVKQELSSKLAN